MATKGKTKGKLNKWGFRWGASPDEMSEAEKEGRRAYFRAAEKRKREKLDNQNAGPEAAPNLPKGRRKKAGVLASLSEVPEINGGLTTEYVANKVQSLGDVMLRNGYSSEFVAWAMVLASKVTQAHRADA
jgi:hypothetical protein